MIRHIVGVMLVLGATGTVFTTPSEHDGKAILAGADTATQRVRIRNIDHGEILWDSSYRLRSRQAVKAGRHVVTVLCEFGRQQAGEALPGQISMRLQPNTTYRLEARPSMDGKSCGVSVSH